jgi:tape measure domain-containing protein
MAVFEINVVVNNTQAVTRIAQVNRDLGAMNNTLQTLQRAFLVAFAVRELAIFARTLAGVAEGLNSLQRSAQIAAGPTGAVRDALDSVVGTADRAGASLLDTSSIYRRFALATDGAGVSQQRLALITDTLVRGFAVFTGTASEANSSITQLAQAFSSGRLAGDEFRSVSENFPPLLQAISEVTGVATTDLREFASQGQITSAVLIQAFELLADRIEEIENRVDQSLEQIINRLSNQFLLLAGSIAEASGITDLYRAAIVRLTEEMETQRLINFGGSLRELEEAIEDQTVKVKEAEDNIGLYGFALNQLGFDIGGVGSQTLILEALTEQYNLELQRSGDAALNAATGQIRLADTQAELTSQVESFNTVQQLQAQEIFDSLTTYEQLRGQLIGLQIGFEASGAAAAEQARILEGVTDTIQDFNTIQQLQAQEIFNSLTVYEQQRAALLELEDQFRSLEGVQESFAEFTTLSAEQVENAFDNLSTAAEVLGANLEDALRGAVDNVAEALDVLPTQVQDALSGTLSILSEFGIEFEDIFGRRATQALRLFGAVTSEEFDGIFAVLDGAISSITNFFTGGTGGGAGGGGGGLSGLLSGVGDLFSSSTDTVSTFGASSISTLTDVNASISDLQGATVGLTTELGETAKAGELSAKSLAGMAAAAAGVAGAIANIAGASATVQAGASIGAGVGAVIGGIVTGNPAGAAIGGVVGGAAGAGIGSLFGGEDPEDKAERKRLEAIAREIGFAIRFERLAATATDLFNELESDEARAVLDELDDTLGNLGETLQLVAGDATAFGETLGRAFGNIAGEVSKIDAARNSVERILTSSLEVLADRFSDSFEVAIVDVLAALNQLPPGTADSFAQIQANAQVIAQALSVQFGVSVDEILAILGTLGTQTDQLFGDLIDPVKVLGVQIAEEFNLQIDDVLAILARLPPGAISSFSDLATNAEVIARNIAVSLGLTFEEALEFVRQFAANAGIQLSGVGTSAADVANQIVTGFSGTDQQLRAIFLNLSRIGIENFENIRQGADGSFRLVDVEAQAALERIVATFGGSEQDIQTILRLLATNADISFTDIFTSGVFAFNNLSSESIASLSAILEAAGFTAEQISVLFGGISADGVTAFADLERTAATTLSAVLVQFGFTEDQILEILNAIADSGATSFSDITGSAGDAFREILFQFGITEDQFRVIFDEIRLGADSAFGDIDSLGGDTASSLEIIFQAALNFIISQFGALDSSASSSLGQIANVASSVGSSVAGSLAAAARSGAASLASITQQARNAQAAINSARNAANTGGNFAPNQFAKGGVITGPVALSGGGAGRSFASGGVLDGLTGIFGGAVTGTNRLGIAGEGGLEAIFPLDRINGRLGVTATIPDKLIEAIRGGGRDRGGNVNVVRDVRVFVIRDASRRDVERIERQVQDLDASVESRTDAVITEVLSELAS